MGDGCLPPEEIDALLAGRLDDAAIERVEAHIDGCASCRQLIGQLAGDSSYDRASTAATLATDGEPAPANTLADDEPPPRPSIRRLRPVRIGRYLVERRLGAGGMGVVYLAGDPELERQVVIKLLRAEVGRENSTRLVREAQAMAKVSHANVVPVFDVGVHVVGGDLTDGQVFLAMEFIDGADLAAWLGQPRGVREVLDVFVAAGRGLAAAHRAGLVHRDFKPHNVMLGKTGEVKVTDFGLARAGLAEPEASTSAADDELGADSPLTRSGALIGTPAYMAPEQIRGEPVDARSDQFSFCVALYEALFGERPFAGKTMTELFESTLEGRLPPSITRRRGVPARVRDAIRRGLRVPPGERFPSMEALLAELAPRASRRAVLATAVAGLALAAVAIALLVTRDRPAEALCSGGAGELAGVWHPARRQAIEAAFLATRAKLAPAAFGAMATAIDRYADTWQAGHRAACEATRVRGEQTEQVMDQRMRCLRRRRAELDALLGVLAAPDDDLMANVTGVVGRLVDPASCGNLEAIASATPPVDPGKRAAVEALEGELAKARAQIAANRTEIARRRLTAALVIAEQVGHKPLIAELHLELGVALLEDNDWADAERELHRAVEVGEEAGADAVRARAFVHLVYVATTVGKLDEAERWARYAQATAERLGNDRRLLAELDLKLAGIAKARGNARQAEGIYLRAIERMSAEYGPRSRDVALARRELGVHYEQIRNYEGAFEQFEATRDIMAAVFGPGNAESVASIGMMAATRYDQQKYDEALVLGDQELAATAAYFGDDHPMTAASYQAHAMRLQGVGRNDEAIAMMQKSAAIMRARYGEDHELHAGVLGSLAVVYSNLGRNDDAFATWSHALAIYVAIYGEAHADAVSLMNALGTIRKRQQRYDEAAALFARARAALARFQQPSSTLVADTLTRIGSLELLRKRYPAALAALEEALRARIAASAEPASMSWTKLELAQVLWDGHGDRARAGKLAREAEAEARAADDRQQLELVGKWLAAHPG